ncbi:MAG: hypothetical protein VB073_13035 [Proteiniphilum sp.]|nr:hypothetical protein [Proteiniphilum sp.]
MNTKGLFVLLGLALFLSLSRSSTQIQGLVPMDESMQQLLDFPADYRGEKYKLILIQN